MGDNAKALIAVYKALGGNESGIAVGATNADIIAAIAVKAAELYSAATAKELPANPTANGTYTLQNVKNSSGATLSWAAAANG